MELSPENPETFGKLDDVVDHVRGEVNDVRQSGKNGNFSLGFGFTVLVFVEVKAETRG